MEDPVTEIPQVIHHLTSSKPSTQLATLNKYFTSSASFIHPFCRTGSWDLGRGWNSRWVVSCIYQWYKILSPTIDLEVQSVAYDSTNLTLYVSIHQKFRIWTVPGYCASVSLVSKLSLVKDNQRYYITVQDDLYQTTEFLKFVWFGIWYVWLAWQFVATVLCILGAWIFSPVKWVEEGEFPNWLKRSKEENKVN